MRSNPVSKKLCEEEQPLSLHTGFPHCDMQMRYWYWMKGVSFSAVHTNVLLKNLDHIRMFTKFNTQTTSPAASGGWGAGELMSAETVADRREVKGTSEKNLNERFVYQDDEIIEKPFNWKEFGRLFGYMKPYARQLLPLIILMMILGTITKLSVPFLISLAIDRAIAPENGLPSMTLLYIIGVRYSCSISFNGLPIRTGSN